MGLLNTTFQLQFFWKARWHEDIMHFLHVHSEVDIVRILLLAHRTFSFSLLVPYKMFGEIVLVSERLTTFVTNVYLSSM